MVAFRAFALALRGYQRGISSIWNLFFSRKNTMLSSSVPAMLGLKLLSVEAMPDAVLTGPESKQEHPESKQEQEDPEL